MVEQISHYRSYEPDIDADDEDIQDHRVAPYRFGHSAPAMAHPDNSVPLFLSDYDGEPDPGEYMTPLRKQRPSISSRILAGVSVAAATPFCSRCFLRMRHATSSSTPRRRLPARFR